MEDIFEKVKEKLNIADVVERYGVHLNHSDMAKCPFRGIRTIPLRSR